MIEKLPDLGLGHSLQGSFRLIGKIASHGRLSQWKGGWLSPRNSPRSVPEICRRALLRAPVCPDRGADQRGPTCRRQGDLLSWLSRKGDVYWPGLANHAAWRLTCWWVIGGDFLRTHLSELHWLVVKIANDTRHYGKPPWRRALADSRIMNAGVHIQRAFLFVGQSATDTRNAVMPLSVGALLGGGVTERQHCQSSGKAQLSSSGSGASCRA